MAIVNSQQSIVPKTGGRQVAGKNKQKHQHSKKVATPSVGNHYDQKFPQLVNGKVLHLDKDCDYERELRRLQVELVKLQEWIRHENLRGRQGRGYQAYHRIAQSPRMPGCSAHYAHRARKNAVVFSEICCASSGCGRDGALRSQLV